MSQLSGFWTTNAGGSGHQQASYTQAQWSTAASIMAACSGFEGVAPGFLNELACTANGANTVAVATGGAMVDGKWYVNDASKDVTIPSAVGGGNTRIDRIVLRCDWSGYQVTITRIAGTDAASPTAPAITQTTGTTYDIQLCRVLVNTAGTVTVTDERTWAATGANGLQADAVTTAKVADNAITTAKIANRTRNLWIGAGAMHSGNATREAVGANVGLLAWASNANDDASVFGSVAMPEDVVAGNVTVKLWWTSLSTGNAYVQLKTVSRTHGEAYDHAAEVDTGLAAKASAGSGLVTVSTLSSAVPVAAGDVLFCRVFRNGSHASDTLNAIMYILGIEVEYTADS